MLVGGRVCVGACCIRSKRNRHELFFPSVDGLLLENNWQFSRTYSTYTHIIIYTIIIKCIYTIWYDRCGSGSGYGCVEQGAVDTLWRKARPDADLNSWPGAVARKLVHDHDFISRANIMIIIYIYVRTRTRAVQVTTLIYCCGRCDKNIGNCSIGVGTIYLVTIRFYFPSYILDRLHEEIWNCNIILYNA